MGDDERGKTWLAGDGLAFPSTTLIAWLYYSEKSRCYERGGAWLQRGVSLSGDPLVK